MSAVQWMPADWPSPPGIVAGTTLRQGGASRGRYASLNLGMHVGDAAASVEANRGRFVSACGLPGEPKWLMQVHGTCTVRFDDYDGSAAADAIVSDRPGQVCAVLTADCLPVLLASEDGREIAAVHAGWRGLCDGILESAISSLGTPPSRLLAWFGPAISQQAFEVGEDVRERFLEQDPASARLFTRNARGRWQADLYGLAGRRLEAAGLERRYGGGRCTFGEPEAFFSYRRDGECGRMASFIVRTLDQVYLEGTLRPPPGGPRLTGLRYGAKRLK
jgi:YfiH family protein